MKKQSLETEKAIKALSYFNFLQKDQILNACRIGSLEQFDPLDTIYYEDRGALTNVHFVLSGECMVLQYLSMKAEKKNGKKIYELKNITEEDADLLYRNLKTPDLQPTESNEILNTNKEARFIDVATLTVGAIFGLGEKLEHRVIMARTTVQCLKLPRYWLFQKEQNPENIWHRRLFYIEYGIPTREVLFEDYLKTLEWEKFKKNYVKSIVRPILNNSTKEEDIPVICRAVNERHRN